MKLYPYLLKCIKLNTKSFKKRNIKPDTVKLLEEKSMKCTSILGTGKDFLNRTMTNGIA